MLNLTPSFRIAQKGNRRDLTSLGVFHAAADVWRFSMRLWCAMMQWRSGLWTCFGYFELGGRCYSSAETNPGTACLVYWAGHRATRGSSLTALVTRGVLSFFGLLRFSFLIAVSGIRDPKRRGRNVGCEIMCSAHNIVD